MEELRLASLDEKLHGIDCNVCVWFYRSVYERHGALGEQHQSDIAEQGGGTGRGRVRAGSRIRSISGVAPVRIVSVAAASPRNVARCVRGQPDRGSRGSSSRRSRRLFWRTPAPRAGRQWAQQKCATSDDQRPSTVRRVTERSDAQTHG